MTGELRGMESLVPSMQDIVREYAGRLQSLAGEHLLSLTLYGAIVTDAFESSRASARSVAVLDAVDLEVLRALAREGSRFGRRRLTAPIIMTPEYIDSSRDTFPLELLEIEQFHVTVLGEDHFEGLEVDAAHVRLQCERELKTLLIGMRQGLLAAAGRDRLLGGLEENAADNLVRILRGLVWLADREARHEPATLVEKTEETIERPLPGVRAAIDPEAEHGWEQFVTLYDDFEALRKKADAW